MSRFADRGSGSPGVGNRRGPVLSYAIIAEYFPKEIAGQANAALNVLHIGSAFVVQYAIGLIVEHWTPYGGHYPPIAYKIAFALNLLLLLATLAWFLRPVTESIAGLTQTQRE